MSARFLAAAFTNRPAPKAYDPSFFSVELARIAKSMTSYVIRNVTASTILQAKDGMLVVNANAGAVTVTLMAPNLASGQPVTIKKSDSSVNKVTIAGTVDGVVNRTLDLPNDAIIIQSDGTTWFRPTLVASGSGDSFTSITVTATSPTANLITYPNTYSNAVWTKTGVTVTSEVETSPVGTLTAALLTGGATDASIAHTVPWTTTSSKEIAIYVKQGTLSRHEFAIYNQTAASFLGILNIQWTAGIPVLTVTAGTLTALTAAPYPDGWYRVSCTIAGVLSTSVYTMLLYTSNRGAGTAGTVYVWGATAYETATATSATAVTVTGASFFYGPLTVTGTVTASALTASLPVATDASKQLITSPVTGTGSTIVMSAGPTITGTTTLDGLTLAPDKSLKVNLGRYSAAFPWSYLRLGSTSSGIRISNAADLLNILELANTGSLSLLIAQATPSALAATQHYTFASTVSGAVLMGYGTTGDVTLKNRAGTDALYVVANTKDVMITGNLVGGIIPPFLLMGA